MVKELQGLFQKYFDNNVITGKPKTLFDPIHFTFNKKGKQLRPIALLLTNQLYGGNIDEAFPVATAIECFHNFTLIHDDIMDDAETRRGQLTAYKKFGVNNAILSGDALMIQVYKYLEELPEYKLKVVLSIFNGVALDVCRGQAYDMSFEDEATEVDEAAYLEMIRLKTAVLLAGSVKIGVYLATEDLNEAEKAYKLSEKMGIAFQIKDDLLDCFGESDLTGKQKGGDILNKKKTLLWIKAHEQAKSSHPRLRELMSKEIIVDEIAEIIDLWKDLGIESTIDQTIESLVGEAETSLQTLNLDEGKKEELWQFLTQFIDRSL